MSVNQSQQISVKGDVGAYQSTHPPPPYYPTPSANISSPNPYPCQAPHLSPYPPTSPPDPAQGMPQPAAAAAPSSYYPPQHHTGAPYGYQQQQQQQQVTVATVVQPSNTVAYVGHRGGPGVSMVGAIVLSCCVFWFFGWLFGAIAFILAMIGQTASGSGDTLGAVRCRNASYGVSVAGLFLGLVVIGVTVGLYVTSVRNSDHRVSVPQYLQYKRCSFTSPFGDSRTTSYYTCLQ